MTKVIIKIMQFLSCSSEAISYAYSNPFLVYNLKKKKSENNELNFCLRQCLFTAVAAVEKRLKISVIASCKDTTWQTQHQHLIYANNEHSLRLN